MTNLIIPRKTIPAVSLYVANYGSSDVTFLHSSGKTLASITIPMAFQPFGVVVDKKRNRAYVTDGDEVSIIDTRRQKVVKTIPVGTQAGFPALNLIGTRLYVPNFRSDTLSVIDTTLDKVIHTIPLGHQPSHAAINTEGTRVYVTNYASSTVSVIDTTLLENPSLINPISTIRVGLNPHGIVVDKSGKFIYVACQEAQTLDKIDAATNKVIGQAPVGKSPDGVKITPDGKELWVANNASNTISVLDAATLKLVRTIEVDSPLEVAFSGSLAFVSEARANRLVMIDRKTYTPIIAPNVGRNPEGVAVA